MKALILAGGQSSRMKQDKATLVRDGRTLLAGAIDALDGHEIFVSAKPNSEFLAALQPPVLFDDLQNIGPAAGLLRAHREAALDDWFVLAVDFPFVTRGAVADLIARHQKNEAAEITCMMNDRPEPLFAIWSPIALERLKSNVKTGFTGPMHTLNECETQLIRPSDARLLMNTNTPEDWALV